jgi:uncharacterized membrane protein
MCFFAISDIPCGFKGIIQSACYDTLMLKYIPMKAQLPRPEHYSILRHRKQRNTQIILPVVIAAILMVALIVLISFSTFQSDGDVGRWAAVSTIWIIIPILFAAFIFLAILIGLIYLMARALSALPYYTAIAQDYVYKAKAYIIRAADMVANPVIAIDGFIENIKVFFERIINP